jgi:site-specific DNA-methyltransferase (adenine-specific)
METNIIYNKDCWDGMLYDIPKESIDFCITSPPYNLGINYTEDVTEDTLPWDKYYEWCLRWLNTVYNVMKPNRRFCLNHYFSCGEGTKNTQRGRSAPLMELNHLAQKVGFKHHAVATWVDATMSRLTAWGSWLSASAPYINSPYEGILILYKGDWKREDKGKSTIDKEEFIEGCSGIWKLHPEKRNGHPAPFPVALAERCIRLFTYEGDVVLDPFMGSGSTAIACKNTNRKWIGFEKSKKYCELAEKRLQTSFKLNELSF